jgi:hypothetical protein
MNWNCRGLVLLTALIIGGSVGCSSNGTTSQTNSPAQPLVIAGQYDLLLTSSKGGGSTNIYTDFTQDGTSIKGTPNTLVCPSNDSSQCKGDLPPAVSIIPNGTLAGTDVTLGVSFPNATGPDTVTMVGSVVLRSLAWTVTKLAGTWTASTAGLPILTLPSFYDLNGTFNSTSNPLQIPPTILIQVGQDPNSNTLSGTATILNSPCLSSLNLSGEAIGDAFILTDADSKVSIIALPVLPLEWSYTFSYKIDPTAASCAGDSGVGELTIANPWDY